MNAPKWILLAEDNPNDADLTLRALRANQVVSEVIVARDGSEALDCLYHRGEFSHCQTHWPALILLDLKMPKVDGLAVLREIKKDVRLKSIPVVMFTSSREVSDILVSYQTGANAYVVKPLGFREFADALKNIGAFWTTLNELPSEESCTASLPITCTATVASH
jgi:CheY-like chemotaxis protein